MDLAIIEPTSGLVLNVIVAPSIEHAQQFYPTAVLVERKAGEMLEPEATLKGNTLVRAADVPESVKLQGKKAALDAEVAYQKTVELYNALAVAQLKSGQT